MKDPKKNWEFPFNDVMERQYGDRYQEVFKGMFSHTSAEYAPWYILPADDEWHLRYIIMEVRIELLEKWIRHIQKEASEENREKLNEYIEILKKE